MAMVLETETEGYLSCALGRRLFSPPPSEACCSHIDLVCCSVQYFSWAAEYHMEELTKLRLKKRWCWATA